MADDQDQSQKTEDPTERKLQESRKRGQVISSREINNWFILLAGTLVLLIWAPKMGSDLKDMLAGFIEHPESMPLDGNSLRDLLGDTFFTWLAAVFVPGILFLMAALLSGFVQHGWLITTEPIKPKLEKISPMKGFKRIFSLRSFVEFFKGIIKIITVATIATVIISPLFTQMEPMIAMSLSDMTGELRVVSLKLMGVVVALITVVAVLDYLYQRFEFIKQQRMTKQEVKDEFKQSEGDPMVKGKLRQLRQEKARRRMMAAVPTADVVVTNPTHFAVALKYEMGMMSAPKVVAKGIDAVALRIRKVAEENDIEIMENPPLARALYNSVEIDQEIPEEHYKAVAEIISYIYKLKRKIPLKKPDTRN